MVNSSQFTFDPRIDKPRGSTLREKLPRSMRLRYVNWGSKECQHFTILIVYQSMLSSFIIYASFLVRPDDPGTDRGSLCFQDCSSVLLIHTKVGRPGDARVVTSCTSVVLGYAGSFGYDLM